MSNKWRRVGKRDRYIYDDRWSVQRDGARWYVYRDGLALLQHSMDAQTAVELAEKLIAREKN